MQDLLDNLTLREKELLEFFISQIEANNGQYIYTVRQLTELLKLHHKTLSKFLDKLKNSGYFVIENLGLRQGYRIKFSDNKLNTNEVYNEIVNLEHHKINKTIEISQENVENIEMSIDETKEAKNSKIEHNQDISKLIGRDKVLNVILKEIEKNRDVLLFGNVGTGKTAILKYIFRYFRLNSQNIKTRKIIYADYAVSFKSFLEQIAYQVHENYRDLELLELLDKQDSAKSKEWKSIKRIVQRMKTNQLAGLILKSIKAKDYIIICDHLETLTPSSKSIFESLREEICLIGATNTIKNNNHLKKLYWRFKQIEITNLDEESTKEFIEYHLSIKNIHTYNKADFIKKIWQVSKGNCSSIYDLIYHADKEKYIDRKHVRDMGHEASRKELSLTGFVIFFGVLVVATRFIALGMNNKDVYIIAGISGAFFMFVRFLLYKSN